MQTTPSSRRTSNRRISAGRPRRNGRAQAKQAHLAPIELGLIACFALAVVIAGVTYFGSATIPQGPVSSVRVIPQQTLWDIAEEHPLDGLSTSETVQVICSLNDLESSSLSIGQTILVPHQESSQDGVVASR